MHITQGYFHLLSSLNVVGFWARHVKELILGKKVPAPRKEKEAQETKKQKEDGKGKKRKKEALTAEQKEAKRQEDLRYRAEQEKIRKKCVVKKKKKAESITRMQGINYPPSWLPTRKTLWERGGTMNASQWLSWLQRAASYTLDGVFPDVETNEMIQDMIHVFNSIGKKSHLRSDLRSLRELTINTLAKWERLAPDNVQPIILHLLFHLVDMIQVFGPVNIYWMFPNERFLGRLGRLIYRKYQPEPNLVRNVLRYSSLISSNKEFNPILQSLQETTAG